MDDCGRLPLRLGEDDVDHFVGGGDRLDGFEVVRHGYAEYWGRKEAQDELLAVFGHK